MPETISCLMYKASPKFFVKTRKNIAVFYNFKGVETGGSGALALYFLHKIEILSYSTACKLTVSLAIQYLLFCSTFTLLYDEVKH